MEIMPYVISSVIALVVCTILGMVLPPWITYVLVGVVSAFMICLVLIQRGRGGGLAGAFGGVGGSSAFGTRAGDVFTRITIVTASVWIALNMGLVVSANSQARQAQAVPGGEFLPEGLGGAGGEVTVPDSGFQTEDVGVPLDGAPGADSPETPVDLPPALDGGQPPNADDADLNVEDAPGAATPGSN
jgi:preprotein translocase subunit SecG